MNSNGSNQCYVSTFRIQLKPPSALPVRNGPETEDIWTSKKRAEAGSSTPSFTKRLEPPAFVEPLQDCHVDEGRNITLRAIITGSQPIKVSWLHNGEVALFGKSSFDGREVSFVVKESLPEDAGAYTCLIENQAGKTSSCSAVFVRDFETLHGLKSHVSSSTTSAPKSLVENERTLKSPTEKQLKFRGACTSSTCSDQLDLSSKEVIPKKRANPQSGAVLHFKNPPQHLTLKAGRDARVTCSFSGSPPIVSCWIRNKDQITDDPELWVETTDLSSTLVIAQVTTQHAGRYTVVVRDRRSSAQHTLTLSVIETPQPPASCPVISRVSATSLALSWSGPCYDGGSAILGYVVEIKNPGLAESADWRKLTDQCTSTSFVVSGLQAHQEYCFRVSAYNEVGISQPGPVSPLVRMEQKDVNKPQEEEGPQNYTFVTIVSTHKVSDDYIVQEKLGMGKFGQVFKLIHKETGQVCAGKFYKGRRAKERDAACKEIELMNYLHHPKLVQCLAAYNQKPEMVMVMEFIAGGELFERIVDDSFEHTEPASVHYVQQILEGVAFMHQQKILHLDLKPENIVCVDTTGTFIKIIDFGLASRIDNTTPLKVMQGTPEFVAPEVINYEPVCLATDMWSIGVICYILLSGESPFQGDNDAETLALVTAAQWEFSEESFEEITQEAKDFISSLLIKETRRRMTCKQALAHPWMAAFDSGELQTKNLSKEKMKKFLARQKWKKAGKALLALKRMALLSKSESTASPTVSGEGSPFSPEAEHALETLEHKMQGPPQFIQGLKDQMVTSGSSARLSCHLTGYPDPEVVWLRGKDPVLESPPVKIEYEEDGCCTLVISKVGPDDSDLYTCKATNKHGEAICSATLTVQE